nr:hypothetical protein GCM10023233_22630 [Brevibacterium otitidis]
MQGLSPASRYRQAILSDPEVAARVVDQEEADRQAGRQQSTQWVPEVRDMTASFVVLTKLHAVLEELVAIQTGVATQGKKSRKPTRIPSPPTAIEAERQRRSIEKNRGLLRRLVPWEYETE